jgi:hypothetical protein
MKRIFVPGLVVLFLAGCSGGKVVSVSGVVKLNGQPYKNAVVSFQPIGSEADPNPGRGSAGVTDENGRFTLTYDGEKPGALVGKHRVRIFTKFGANDAPLNDKSESRPDAKQQRFTEPIPAEWNELSNTEFEVPSGGTDKADFLIESKPARK